MNGTIWLKWLKWFDSHLERDSILLADNCPAHVDSTHLKFRFLKLHFLPPNVTSVIQPMDAGIIRSFKAYYRKNLVKFWLGLIGRKNLKPNEMKPNLKQAIEFLDEAWSSVTESTIKNCWIHTDILPMELLVEDYSKEEDKYQESVRELGEMLIAFNSESAEDVLSAEEFCQVDRNVPVSEDPTDAELIRSTLTDSGIASNVVEDQNDTDDDAEEAFVTTAEGEKAFHTLKVYMEQRDVDYQCIRDLKKIFESANQRTNFVQTRIDKFLS